MDAVQHIDLDAGFMLEAGDFNSRESAGGDVGEGFEGFAGDVDSEPVH